MNENGKRYRIPNPVLQNIVNNSRSKEDLLNHLKIQIETQQFSDASDSKYGTAVISFVLENDFGMSQEDIDEWMRKHN